MSAYDLAWSYSSLITANRRRNAISPSPWGEPGTPSVPPTCSATSVQGTYSAATISAWPPMNGFPTATPMPCEIPPLISVTFEVTASTVWGEGIRAVGSILDLGSWDPAKGVVFHADRYTSSQPIWYATVRLPAGQSFVYKYIRTRGGEVVWEEGLNRQLDTPAVCGTKSLYRRETWR